MAAELAQEHDKPSTRAYAGVYIVVILAVLAAVNFLANRYDKSYDSTANKQFSLSDQTIKVVKGLKNDVTSPTSATAARFPQRARPAGPLRRALAQAARRVHRSGEEAAAGQSRRLPPRRRQSWWTAARARKAPRASPKKKSPAR